MNKPLYLFVGKSASGKTTIADIIEQQYQHKQVYSYCTRPPRYDGEIGHVFVSDEEFDKLGKLVAYTEYNGYRYGTTAKQLDQCSIYVVDVLGVETLLERYHTKRQIVIVYFDATVYTRINRMLDRGDSDMSIIARLLQDEKESWLEQLNELVWYYRNFHKRSLKLYFIDANMDQSKVLEKVLTYIKT